MPLRANRHWWRATWGAVITRQCRRTSCSAWRWLPMAPLMRRQRRRCVAVGMGRARAMARYHRPASLEDALAIRAGEDVTVLAGGTDVYPAKAARAGWGDMHQADILDITSVPGLRGIAEEAAQWRIGALTTWTDLIRAE